jgi:hypothetical protein
MSVATLMVIMMVVTTPMPVTFRPVTPFFIGFMLVMPMIPVSVIMTVPDELLIRRLSAEMIKVPSVFVETQISLWLIYHLFVTVIKVKIAITGRQLTGKCPMAPVKIDKLMIGYIIIGLYVRNIIIFYMIIPRRPPGRLRPNVYGKLNLCRCWIQQGRHCKKRSCH